MEYFFSYGDDRFTKSKIRIEQEARIFGFDHIKIYGREDIEPYFIEKTKPFINAERGGGYWLWKPYFLKKTFDTMEEGDICIYADAGCQINSHGKDRYRCYLELIKHNSVGNLSFSLLSEEEYTNERVFEFFNLGINSETRKTGQYNAGVIIMRKCNTTIKIVEEFYDIAISHGDLFSDIHNDYRKSANFKDHRHDQSILSLLRKKHGSIAIPDETYAITWSDLSNIPILVTRIWG